MRRRARPTRGCPQCRALLCAAPELRRAVPRRPDRGKSLRNLDAHEDADALPETDSRVWDAADQRRLEFSVGDRTPPFDPAVLSRPSVAIVMLCV